MESRLNQNMINHNYIELTMLKIMLMKEIVTNNKFITNCAFAATNLICSILLYINLYLNIIESNQLINHIWFQLLNFDN